MSTASLPIGLGARGAQALELELGVRARRHSLRRRMAPVDPDLAALLEDTASRSVRAADGLSRELALIREELAIDRRRDDDRFVELGKRVAELATTLEEVDERCGALVVEEDGEDGAKVVRARPATLGLDGKTVLGAIVALITAGVTPVLIAYLSGGHHP